MNQWKTLADIERDCRYAFSSGGELVYFCPKCGYEDKRGHLYLNPKRGAFCCFRGCGLKGFVNIVDIGRIMPIEKEVDTANFPKNAILLYDLPDDEYELVMHAQPLLDQFLRQRNLTYPDVFEMKLAFTATGYLTQSIIIPVFSEGRMVSYLARNLIEYEDGRKYTHSSHLKNYLYNYEIAKRFPTIVVVESIWDAYKIGDYAISSFGATISKEQRTLIRQMNCEKLIIFFDANKIKEAFNYMRLLSDLPNVAVVLWNGITGNIGPSQISRKEILEQISNARKPSLYQVLTHS